MPVSLPEPADDAALRAAHREDQRRLSARYLQRLNWSRERLNDERRRGLRALVAVAQERSPWHRRRLARVDARSLQERELSRLPVMTKHDVMANFDEIVTDRRVRLSRVESHLAGLDTGPRYLLERYQAVVSGGSSGVRGVFVYDWPGWASCYAGAFRYFMRDFGGRPISLAVVAAGSAAHISRAILHTFSDPATVRIHPVPITLPTQRIVAGLNEIQPQAVFTYASGLLELVEAARAGRLTIAPRAIITGGEPLTTRLRLAAESTFDAKVLNWWVSTEAGPMGIGCGHGPWMHLSEDLMIVEPVDEDGQAVPPGARSAKVLLTVLYNHAFPLIRYELSDEVTVLDRACPCGSPNTLIADVQGRRDDSFSYYGVVVDPHVFRSILSRARGIIEYRVIQTERGARVEIRGEADHQELRRQLVDALSALGVNRPDVSIVTASTFERQPTGKVKRFIALSD
jgi:phenylacetate-coenzyme A ligase PaaK-like adenylate-forming protein